MGCGRLKPPTALLDLPDATHIVFPPDIRPAQREPTPLHQSTWWRTLHRKVNRHAFVAIEDSEGVHRFDRPAYSATIDA